MPHPEELCPQDSSHPYNEHMPGGGWFEIGHNGLPSPWPSWGETKQKVEMINHPAHYNQYKGVEIIDLVEQMNFNRGNAVKYISCAGLKDPKTEVEDLEKARWYLDREIDRLKKVKG